jgi:hypothetical protein
VEAVPHLFYACAAKCWAAIEKTVQKLLLVQHNKLGQYCMVDPDPRGSALILVGWIQIRIFNTGGQKITNRRNFMF